MMHEEMGSGSHHTAPAASRTGFRAGYAVHFLPCTQHVTSCIIDPAFGLESLTRRVGERHSDWTQKNERQTCVRRSGLCLHAQMKRSRKARQAGIRVAYLEHPGSSENELAVTDAGNGLLGGLKFAHQGQDPLVQRQVLRGPTPRNDKSSVHLGLHFRECRVQRKVVARLLSIRLQRPGRCGRRQRRTEHWD